MACNSNSDGKFNHRKNHFARIYQLEEATAKIIEIGEEAGIAGLSAKADDACGALPVGTFEEVVDYSQAHASLTRLMNIAKQRFAYAVTVILSEKPDCKAAIMLVADEWGKNIKIPADYSAEQVFGWIADNILDSMPCDKTKAVIENGEAFKWLQLEDTYKTFFDAVKGDVAVYREFEETLLNAALSDNALNYSIDHPSVMGIFEGDYGCEEPTGDSPDVIVKATGGYDIVMPDELATNMGLDVESLLTIGILK